MKKSFSLKSFYTFSIVGAGVIIATALTLLFTIGGVTEPSFTLSSLGLPIIFKSLTAVALVFGLTLVYHLIIYKKPGLKIALFSLIGAALSGAMGFSFCVICRAPLGNITLAIILASVAVSYISSALFFRAFGERSGKKKKQPDAETPFEKASSKSFRIMLLSLVLIVLILAASFAISLIFGSTALATCVLPAILSFVCSVVITLAFACRMYADKN